MPSGQGIVGLQSIGPVTVSMVPVSRETRDDRSIRADMGSDGIWMVLKIIYTIWMRYFYGFVRNPKYYPPIQGSRVSRKFSFNNWIHWKWFSDSVSCQLKTQSDQFSRICELFNMVCEYINQSIWQKKSQSFDKQVCLICEWINNFLWWMNHLHQIC